MFVFLEYLTYLAIASVLGVLLFTIAVLALVTWRGAQKLWEQASVKVPELAARVPLRRWAELRYRRPHRPAHSH